MPANNVSIMSINNADKKRFRQIGHDLKPIVTIAQKGLTENILLEVKRALNDHELIKIKVVGADRDQKKELVDVLCTDCLLYTSPSPRDRQKSRMPSSA